MHVLLLLANSHAFRLRTHYFNRLLGSKPRMLLWTVLGIGTLCGVIALAAFFWHLGKSSRTADTVRRPPAETTRVFEKRANTGVAEVAASEDDRAIEALCRAFYERSNEKDFEAIHQMVATPCRPIVTLAVLEKRPLQECSGSFSLGIIGVASQRLSTGSGRRPFNA